MVNGNTYQKIERENALGSSAHHLHHVIAALRAVRHLSEFYQFGLELPPEQLFLDALTRLSTIHKQALESTP